MKGYSPLVVGGSLIGHEDLETLVGLVQPGLAVDVAEGGKRRVRQAGAGVVAVLVVEGAPVVRVHLGVPGAVHQAVRPLHLVAVVHPLRAGLPGDRDRLAGRNLGQPAKAKTASG